MELFRILVVGLLLAVVFNLGLALYHLATDRGGSDREKSGKVLKALTWRVSLSVGLVLLILIAWRFGLIHPHAVGG